MSKHLPSIIIGIPAFNEEANIGVLLQDIEKQKAVNFKIKSVIVNSDASTDDTEKIAKSSTRLPVQVLTHQNRKGIATRLNEIISIAKKEKVDALVLFDADVRIADRNCIQTLIKPILEKQIDLTSCQIDEANQVNWIDRALKVSMIMKSNMFGTLRDGDNVYTCYGPVRAFSTKLVSKLTFPYSIGNDAYSYLFVKRENMKYAFVKGTSVLYKLPTVLSDHANQSQRFLESQKLLSKSFGKSVIQSEYNIPTLIKVKAVVNSFVQAPVSVILYLGILASMKVKYLTNEGMPDLWDHVSSSKSHS